MARGLSADDRRILDEAIKAPRNGLWINVRPDPIDFRDRIYQPGFIALAPRLDPLQELAEIPVRDQGYLGSCTGMALATAIDVLRLRQWTLDGSPKDKQPKPVSARMLYEMGRAFDEHPDDGLPGSSVRGALRGFFHNGVCHEIEIMDDPTTLNWEFTIERARDARNVTLGVYARLQHVLLDYHCALNEIRVIIASTKLHEGWRLGGTLDSDDAAEHGRIRWDGSQKTLGGHAVVIVGYDETGFLIRNSWGEGWSHWRSSHADNTSWSGVAHWSYDDWQGNVMDGWVIRLGVAGSHDASAIGGSFTVPGVPKVRSRGSTPRILVNGHYLHVKDGRFVTSGSYNCSQRSIEETAKLLQTTTKYDHLLIVVASGLDPLDTMVEQALTLIDHLKKALRIYPLFVWWRDGCFEFASELLEDRARRLEPRTGGVQQLGARMLETFAREFMQPFWRTFEGEAERAFTLSNEKPKRGAAWVTLRTLLGAARNRVDESANPAPLLVHAVAHSAGAVWLGELCRRLVDPATTGDGWPGPKALDGLFQTVSLIAPVCAPDLFGYPKRGKRKQLNNSAVRRLWAVDGQSRLGIYTLRPEDEGNDRVGAFQGSFLRLAQCAFPIGGWVPDGSGSPNEVLGDARVARSVGERREAEWFPINGNKVRSSCRTHRGLAADIAVLEHVLSRVTGRTVRLPFGRLG